MNIQLLSKDYVEKNGVTYDDLYPETYSDRLLDADEDNGGQPYTGIVYDKYDNDQLEYYYHYKDGFPEGEYICFYENGNIKSYHIMINATIEGEEREWYPDGQKKRLAEYKYGVCLSYQEWDEKGQLIAEKKEPTENDRILLNTFKSWYY